MLKFGLYIAFNFISLVLWAQPNSTFLKVDTANATQAQITQADFKIYKGHPKWEIPAGIILISSASYGVKQVEKIATLTEEGVTALNPASINAFDRPAAYYDPAGFKSAADKSDIIMTLCIVSPAILMLDKKMKNDWADLLGILLMAHTVDNAIFFSSVLTVRRPRPIEYNAGLSTEIRAGTGKTNSFFSGHESWSATSCFFIAKVYTDYHKIKGLKRLLIYTGAAIPPTIVSYYRVHAGAHFNTDVITGTVVGAACGILLPALHKIRLKDKGLSVRPFYKLGANGVSLSYRIK